MLVVIGHWLLAVLGFRDGTFVGENLLELAPDLQIATWIFQVMPIFFLVGGYTTALSWASAAIALPSRERRKDPGPDQFLVFDTYGHEVWQLRGADPENPYVAPLRR